MPERLIQLREVLAGAQQRAQEAIDAVLALPDDAAEDILDAAVAEQTEAEAEAQRAKDSVDKREALLRSRDQHQPVEGTPPVERAAQPRGAQMEEEIYRPDQRGAAKGFFYDLALAEGGDPQARERLTRNNKMLVEHAKNDTKLSELDRQQRAGDLTTATHMGEFIVPQWTNQLYAQLLRAGRPFADQCMNMGEPVSNSWNIPRITTGATTAAQTEASALSNQDQVSDSVTGIMQTIGGYSIASYQLVDLAEPGMDQILFADLTSSLNQQVDSSLLNSATTSAKGLLQLASINSVTFTATTPTVALLWPYFFQAKSAIEKNTYLEVDFCIMHPTTWNWILSGLDSNNRPLFLSTSGNAFNAMAEYNLNAQGWAGNIAGIPVLIDANMPVTGGAGTNQGTIALVNRSALLVKEGAARYKVADQRSVETLQYYFVAFKYLQRIFGRHPTKISAITGTGLVVQSGF